MLPQIARFGTQERNGKIQNFPRFVRSDLRHVLSHLLSISRFTTLENISSFNYCCPCLEKYLITGCLLSSQLFSSTSIEWWQYIHQIYRISHPPSRVMRSENFDKYSGSSSLSKKDNEGRKAMRVFRGYFNQSFLKKLIFISFKLILFYVF